MIGTAALVAGAGLEGAGTSPLAGPAALTAGAAISAYGFTANAGPAELSGGAVVAAAGFSASISGTATLSAGAVLAAQSTSISGTATLIVGAVLSGANNGAQLEAGATFAGTGTVGVVGTGVGRWLYLHTKPPAQVYATDAVRDRLRAGQQDVSAHFLDHGASLFSGALQRTPRDIVPRAGGDDVDPAQAPFSTPGAARLPRPARASRSRARP